MRYRVGLLLFACAIVALALFSYGFWAHLSPWKTFVQAAILLSIMEAFYLLGAFVRLRHDEAKNSIPYDYDRDLS